MPDHRAEIEGEVCLELASELLHALVFKKAADVQQVDATVARGEQAAFEQRRADTVALPWFLNAEGGLRLTSLTWRKRPVIYEIAA